MTNRVAAIAVVIAFLAGTVFATFSEMRVFLPALLQGARWSPSRSRSCRFS